MNDRRTVLRDFLDRLSQLSEETGVTISCRASIDLKHRTMGQIGRDLQLYKGGYGAALQESLYPEFPREKRRRNKTHALWS